MPFAGSTIYVDCRISRYDQSRSLVIVALELVFPSRRQNRCPPENPRSEGRASSPAVSAMPSWKVWPSPPHGARTVWLELVVRDLRGLPLYGVQDVRGSRADVLVQWVGSGGKSGIFRRGKIERSCTARQPVSFDGAVNWREGFHHQCKLKMADSQRFRSWIVDLEIHVFGSISNDYTSFLAKTRLDISKFASDDQERTVGIPVRCIVRGFMAEALLTVTLRISTRQAKGSILPAITRGLSLRASSSRAFPHTDSGDSRPSLGRIMSWNGAMGRILPEKATRGAGATEVKGDRRVQSRVVPSSSIPSQPPDEEKDGLLMVGWWEEKTVTSRDGLLELSTEIFFASIDQRSEKAAGESACSVLAAVFADWLHRNPGDLPLRCQFDELVREGSSEWRSLCADAGHAARFSDRHFDLDTVLTARLRPLTVLTEKSYVGFFAMPDEGTELIQGAMSFDQMWDEVVGAEAGEDRVYIAGWNDHFFVLKVEKEAIYLIDTLGERLFEGCNQAYILKFDRESRVFSKDLAADGGGGGAAARHLVCRGLGSCKEFIKGFLAAVPLRELQEEMERGLTREDRHHRLLQIEFHYTSPL